MLSCELYVAEKMRGFEAERLRRVNLPYTAPERRHLTLSAVTGLGRLLVRVGEVLARTQAVDTVAAGPRLAKHA